MKKHLLIPVSAILLCSTAIAQKTILAPIKNKTVANKSVKVSRNQTDIMVGEAQALKPSPSNQLRSVSLTNVGTSTYQLQTNNAVQNRIVKNADGTISACFTYAATGTWTDRGTGYVYHNGTSWSAAPTARIEPVRTGWPSLFVLGDNSEGVITHNTAGSNLHISKRPTKGTGAFTHDATIIASTASYGDFWPRACAGGAGNNSIHMISISNPTDGAATPTPVFQNGQQGSITYSRSLDGGTTWDKLHQVQPQHDSTQYYGFNADSYAIDARGNTIAYVVGGDYTDLFIMKSLDNGTTWTKTIITTFPIPMFNDQLSDVNSDSVADTISTNDGSVAILIDNNDDVHVWAGRMRIIDDTPGDDASSYFPGTDGLMYWNENMGASAPVDIAGMEDTDADLVITVSDWGTYYCSLTSQPSVGIDAAGTMYLTYSSLVEYTDFGDGKSMRNIYYMSSSDAGTTWTTPIRMSADEFTEQVFCSVARNADPTCVNMIFQADVAPGTGVTSTSADYANNTGVIVDQIYACLNPAVGIAETTNLSTYLGLFPNPSSTNVTVNTISTIDKIEVFNTLGALVMSVTPNANSTVLDIAGFTNGMYMVSVKTAGRTISKPLIKE
jgi:hypothetical protein